MANESIAWKTEKKAEDGSVTQLSGEFTYDFPETVEECVQKFGAETVRQGFKKAAVIYLQASARREASKDEKPMTAEQIAEDFPSRKIVFTERETVDPVDKIAQQFDKLSPEKRAALLASLTEMLA